MILIDSSASTIRTYFIMHKHNHGIFCEIDHRINLIDSSTILSLIVIKAYITLVIKFDDRVTAINSSTIMLIDSIIFE